MRWFIVGIALVFNLFTLPLSPLSAWVGVLSYAQLPVYRLLYRSGWQAAVWYGVNGLLLSAFALSMAGGLYRRYGKGKSKRIPKIRTLEQLQSMQWQDFEALMQRLFEKKGFSVERIGGNGADGGIDLVLRHSFPKRLFTRPLMVQCKRYRKENKIGVAKVREYAYIRREHGFSTCILASTSDFTRQAKEQAAKENGRIVLMNGEDILKQLKNIS